MISQAWATLLRVGFPLELNAHINIMTTFTQGMI
jgi:hypothetical protein